MSDVFVAPDSLRMDSALAVEAQGLAAIGQGARRFDLSALTSTDSSAVAVILAWRRAAAARGVALEFVGAQRDLTQLADLYGVAELAFGSVSPASAEHH